MFPSRQAVDQFRRYFSDSALLQRSQGIDVSAGIAALVLLLMLASH
ncbi:MAG: hypothetical protein QG584_1284 [Pseudomonadota bacterium]|nr:hypothetical protein [Pseudomonadota bacterium]MDQ5905255.1 hypothetical protein [Pseudomonadota bacterium]MDQ5915393.1 hypothetical protein [Pseudomonadota bacterium]